MYKGFTISVVIPCHNEEEGITRVISGMPDFVDEIVVVDNNCTDRTAEIAKSMGALVVYEPIKGYGNAYKAGFKAAQSDIIATADGDNTYPTSAITDAIDAMRLFGWDFVSGNRFPLRRPRAMNPRNVIGNKILTYATRLLYGIWINDSQSGMWVFKRECLEHMRLRSPGMSFSEEIKIEAILSPRIRFGETSIDYRERVGQTKLMLWKDGWNNLTFLLEKRLMR